MKTFRAWFNETVLLSETALPRVKQQEVQRIYDTVTKLLLGAAKEQLHVPLSDISDDEGADGQPPQNKGPKVALQKLSDAQVFTKLQQLGDPDMAHRANDAMNWLQKIASDQTIGPQDTVGGLLDKMFGPDSARTYGQHKWKVAPKTPTQTPQDSGAQPTDATSVPMAQQLGPAPAPAPAPMPGPMPMPGVPPVDPNAAAAPQPAPEDPNMPTTPNGPMPPKPPGGLV